MLGAVSCHDALETLDLRAERRIHAWDRHRKRRQGPRNPKVCILPLVKGASKDFDALKKVDLSGNKLSSDSVHAFITSLHENSKSLTKLMLRDTFLDGPAVKAITHLLKDNTCGLRELDISHNGSPLTRRGVLQELCASLKTNTTIQSLKLEHCCLKLSHMKVLAGALPEMRGLQHLCLNGNWDTKVALAEGPGILVDALEFNPHLLTLEVGSLSFRSARTCTTPSYSICRLDDSKVEKLHDLLRRNNEAYDEKRKQRVELLQMDKSLESDFSCLADWRISNAQALAA